MTIEGKPKDRRVAAVLAFAGAIPIPVLHATVSGLHKFYLGQTRWGILYLLLCFTPIPAIASVLEGAWYLFQDGAEFDRNFNGCHPGAIDAGSVIVATQMSAIAEALRELEALRQEELITEYEFEQKRRQLLGN